MQEILISEWISQIFKQTLENKWERSALQATVSPRYVNMYVNIQCDQ